MPIISSSSNALFKEWLALTTKAGRAAAHQYLVEGENWLRGVTPAEVAYLIVAESKLHLIPAGDWGEKLVILNDRLLTRLSDTETCAGLMAVYPMRTPQWQDYPQLILLDEIQDPGNLGTIIRAAAAAACPAVLLSERSVDLYNPKVIRSTMGYLSAVDVYTEVNLSTQISTLRQAGYVVWGLAGESSTSLFQVSLPAKVAWVVGNESRGLHPDLKAQCDQLVAIPQSARVESLNAAMAATLAMYEYARHDAAILKTTPSVL